MSGKLKTYIGILMLLISVVFSVPFSWLHQCEYSHEHALSATATAESPVLSAELATCPLCELEFPLYLLSNFSFQFQPNAGYAVFSAELPEKIFAAAFSHFLLRGPPVS